MQMKEAQRLRIEWAGKKHIHSDEDLVKEYYDGSPTGDYVCRICGASGYGKNWISKENSEIHKTNNINAIK
ncbi:hypothetical protein ACNUFM_003392 [Vibrio cholerae]